MIVLIYLGIGALLGIILVALDRNEDFPPPAVVLMCLPFWPFILVVGGLCLIGGWLRDKIWDK